MNNLVELTGLVSVVAPMQGAEGPFILIVLTVDGDSMAVMAWGEAQTEVEVAGIGPGDQVSLRGRLNLEQSEFAGEVVSLPTIELKSLVAVEKIRFDRVA